jgi:hypothetical protein
MTAPTNTYPDSGYLDPTNVHVWETGDLLIFDPTQTFVEATHIPTGIDDDIHAAWLPVGLILGDPGIEMPRDIDETDLNAWQLKRYRTKWRNGKLNGTATLLEDNAVVDDLLNINVTAGIGVGLQPAHKSRRLALVFWDSDTNYTERRFTKIPANLFVENDSKSEEPKGRPVRLRFYPDANSEIFYIQTGIPT